MIHGVDPKEVDQFLHYDMLYLQFTQLFFNEFPICK